MPNKKNLNPSVRIKAGREKSLLRRHPWVFSGAVADVYGDPAAGETLAILSNNGEFLAWGAYSPASQIRCRVWTWEQDQVVDQGFFRQRLVAAIIARQAISSWESCSACRLVHAESDLLPGVIVDRYADWLVVQFLSSGAETWKEVITNQLLELLPVKGVYERSDVDVRRLEGLPERRGPLVGGSPLDKITIEENGLLYHVDIENGHKTGFYLDQRVNRQRIREISKGREVLDCFCYTGGFSVAALAGGAASVTAVDASADALSLARDNCTINGFPVDAVEFVEGDVFHVLRRYRDMNKTFDLIVLDPPKFAVNASQVEKAARGYKDINLLGLKLLRPGGWLATFSCSGGVDGGLFQKIVASAALDAGVEATIVERLHQAPDHPVALNFPEGAYLKGLLVYRR